MLVVQGRAQDRTAPQSRGVACFWGGARGWNTDQFGRQLSSPLVRPFGVWNAGGDGEPVVGTLLGPEGAGDRFVSCQGRPSVVPLLSLWGWWVWRWSVDRVSWLLVENCTVDASIFNFSDFAEL